MGRGKKVGYRDQRERMLVRRPAAGVKGGAACATCSPSAPAHTCAMKDLDEPPASCASQGPALPLATGSLLPQTSPIFPYSLPHSLLPSSS